MNEAVEKVVKAGKKVLAMAGLPFSSKYEAEEVWGINTKQGMKFITL